ncbi:MFS transporter [Bradyrhizobium sp. CCBAU 11361]|uniref:MFS transporter n=1 Tax=Bradyrhizobium sp. CCBAU 11361 TaxID=1630812 RepID=UPI002304EBCE|nr:MFS transporter [Bradyrhizobium sp. CCBAU 11361]MDA9491878.1 MFS transporter [Bradyrhizobium sp. CCBAU 11361]
MASVELIEPRQVEVQGSKWQLIVASTLGGFFEWYDFYVYAALATLLAPLFFPPGNDTVAFMGTLATFGAGFLVRPLGALVFGRLGDLVGRKVTFLITMSVMGLATIGVGFLPTFATAGIWATGTLVALRLIQGFAHGGETGGAVTYLAENSPPDQRGFQTSFLQTTAAGGLLVSIIVTLSLRSFLTDVQFQEWGWRIPFIVSIFLLATSIYIRTKLEETPIFKQMKEAGKLSKRPVGESLGAENRGRILLLFVLCAGLGGIFGACLFQTMFFMTKTLALPVQTVQVVVCIAMVLATPFYLVFGWLSDRIGRKPVMLAAYVLSALTTFPIFWGITHYGNPRLEAFLESNPIVITAPNCNFRVFAGPSSDCDRIAGQLSDLGVAFTTVAASPGTQAQVTIAGRSLAAIDKDSIRSALVAAGWPQRADVSQANLPALTFLVFLLDLYLAIVFAPIAAFMAELFPARHRYTSMSLPFHLGAGWIGGFLPFGVAALNIYFGNLYSGLWYPVVCAAVAAVIGFIAMPETYKASL